jgi:hypothetical protein
MATHKGPFDFNGSLYDLTFYRRRDMDKNLVREKTGPTKEQILHDPRYALTHKNCTEFDGCSKGSKWIRRALRPLEAVRDYNWAGTLTGLLKPVQVLDGVSKYGQRSVLLSQHPHLLEGFSLSRQTPFDSVIRTPIGYSVDKDALSTRVLLPPLVYGVNFSARTPHPYFRILASLGVVPDLSYSPFGYTPDEQLGQYVPQVAHTEWLGVKSGLPETALELSLPYPVEFPSFSLVLAVAVSFGTLNALGNVVPVKYSGSGRIAVVV